MKSPQTTKLAYKKFSVVIILLLAFAAMPVKPAYAAVAVPTQWNGTAIINYAGNVTPQTGTYVVGGVAGTNRLMVVAIAGEYNVGPQVQGITATYGGQALTMITKETSTRQTVWVGYLKEAGIAAATNTTLSVAFNATNLSRTVVHAANYNGVEQNNPIVASASTVGAAVPELTFTNINTVNTGYIFYVANRNFNGTATEPAGGGYTEHFDVNYGPNTFSKSLASKATTGALETGTVTFTGGNDRAALAVVSLRPAIPPAFTSAAPGGGTVNNPYTHTYAASGSTPITYALTAGAFPPGLSLVGGVLSGMPMTAGRTPAP